MASCKDIINDQVETILIVEICHAELMHKLIGSVASYSLVIDDFEDSVEQVFSTDFHGYMWVRLDNRRIYLYDDPTISVMASLRFFEYIKHVNKKNKILEHTPLFVRIGIDTNKGKNNLKDVAQNNRQLDKFNDIQNILQLVFDCPAGQIAISTEVYEKLEILDGLFRPAVRKTKCFFLENRLLNPQEEKLIGYFTPKQKVAIPALCFLDWRYLKPSVTLNEIRNKITQDKWSLILGESNRPARGQFTSAATSDAVVLIEALTGINRLDLQVGIDEWPDTADLVTDRNVIIVGSGTINLYASIVNHVVEPLHFNMTKDFRTTDPIIAGGSCNKTHFGLLTDGQRDSGLIVISKSIFNLDKTIIWIGGITGMATQSVLTFFRDLLADKVKVDDRAIGCVIGPYTSQHYSVDISEYNKKWRISNYRIVHQVDSHGHELGK